MDDDVISDEDVIRSGIKYSYKSLLQTMYPKSYLTFPPLVIPNSFFE